MLFGLFQLFSALPVISFLLIFCLSWLLISPRSHPLPDFPKSLQYIFRDITGNPPALSKHLAILSWFFLFTSHLPPEVPHLCMDLLRVVLYLLCSELLLSWIWCLHSEHCSVLWCKIQQVSWNSLTCADMAWEGAEHLSRLFLGKGKAVAAQSSSKGSLCQLPPGTDAGAGAVEVSSLFGSLWESFTGWKHTVCFERLILNFWSLLWDQNRSCGFLLSLQRHSCTFCFLSFLAGYSVGNFPVVLLQTTSDF